MQNWSDIKDRQMISSLYPIFSNISSSSFGSTRSMLLFNFFFSLRASSMLSCISLVLSLLCCFFFYWGFNYGAFCGFDFLWTNFCKDRRLYPLAAYVTARVYQLPKSFFLVTTYLWDQGFFKIRVIIRISKWPLPSFYLMYFHEYLYEIHFF